MRLPPADAIAYFESKGYRISWNWGEVRDASYARAFTVAKAARMDVLQDFREALQQTLEEGLTEREFIRMLEPKLKAKGWWGKQVVVDPQGGAEVVQLGSPHRLRTIYRANKFGAYQAGRYKRQKMRSRSRPFWQYVAILDSRTRPSHASLNGQVFRHDDPIWEAIYPPNGFNCRCRVRALSEVRLKAEGLAVQNSRGRISEEMVDAGLDKRTGEVFQKPVTVFRGTGPDGRKLEFRTDPGFNTNQGQLAFGTDVEAMRKITAVGEPAIRAQAIQALNNSTLRQAQFAAWVDDVMPNRGAGHSVQTVHFMDERAAAAYQVRGIDPARVLVINEKNLAHIDSPKHWEAGIALTTAELKSLPNRLARGEAKLFWDKAHRNLVFALEADPGVSILMAATAGRNLKMVAGRLDQLVNVFKIPTKRLENQGRFEPVDG
jgi:SPP1 gp7 family putative phage head morphogenesis protein